jgi:hypothetical protein
LVELQPETQDGFANQPSWLSEGFITHWIKTYSDLILWVSQDTMRGAYGGTQQNHNTPLATTCFQVYTPYDFLKEGPILSHIYFKISNL